MRRFLGLIMLALLVGCDGGETGTDPDDPAADADGDGISNGDETWSRRA